MRPKEEKDLLWALKGAGTNFGIVVSIVFKAFATRSHRIEEWSFSPSSTYEAIFLLVKYHQFIIEHLDRKDSADAYLFWDNDKLNIGVTLFTFPHTDTAYSEISLISTNWWCNKLLGPATSTKAVDDVGLFESDMYLSGMHGGHGGGKTSSFKRCVFLNTTLYYDISKILIEAVEARPSPLCYLHLLSGRQAVSDVAAEETAFGCRDWDIACVITGVWPRDQYDSKVARATVQWVYEVAKKLLPFSNGVYGADLGPDPRDAQLAAKAFGPNRSRLARLKLKFDPHNVLAYACPLPRLPTGPNLIILVTGQYGTGKDYCAHIWASELTANTNTNLKARVVSISDAAKREYALATGADLNLLVTSREYKEKHRAPLTAFYQSQLKERPRLPEDRFLNVVHGARGVDMLLITGMRDEAPMANFPHLFPDSRFLVVRVEANNVNRAIRRGHPIPYRPNWSSESHCHSLIFDNDEAGDAGIKKFAGKYMLPFFHEDLQRLAGMVRSISDFPRAGIDFRHVLGIPQHHGGLELCTSLLQTHFTGDWSKIDRVVACEAGGYVFAAAFAVRVSLPLTVIRKGGKLPPPTISVTSSTSHISDSTSESSSESVLEIGRDAIPKGSSVVVIDDALASGGTLCGVLELLSKAGIKPHDINVMVVAEFPSHRGRDWLYRHNFGNVNIQSLLVFGGT